MVKHRPIDRERTAEVQRHYDQTKRNKQATAFYRSAAWQAARLAVLIRDHYLCQPCLRQHRLTTADAVHHIKSLEEAPELALDQSNLEAICNACHNKEHPEKGQGSVEPAKPRRARIIVTQANDEVT